MPSSVIQWMRYDPRQRTLLIAFQGNRGTYRYFDVPASEWMAFRAARSKGTYLNTHFKEAGYGYDRVDAGAEAPNSGLQGECFWGELPG